MLGTKGKECELTCSLHNLIVIADKMSGTEHEAFNQTDGCSVDGENGEGGKGVLGMYCNFYYNRSAF